MSEDRIVDSAYDRARSRYTTEDWLALSARAITAAVYKEIRKIDAERLLSCDLSKEADGSDAERSAP